MASIAFEFGQVGTTSNSSIGCNIPHLYVVDSGGVLHTYDNCYIRNIGYPEHTFCLRSANGVQYNVTNGDLVSSLLSQSNGVSLGSSGVSQTLMEEAKVYPTNGYYIEPLENYSFPSSNYEIYSLREDAPALMVCELVFIPYDVENNSVSGLGTRSVAYKVVMKHNGEKILFDSYVLRTRGMKSTSPYSVSGYFGSSLNDIQQYVDENEGAISGGSSQDVYTYKIKVFKGNDRTTDLVVNNSFEADYDGSEYYVGLYKSTNGVESSSEETGVEWTYINRTTGVETNSTGSGFLLYKCVRLTISARIDGVTVDSISTAINPLPLTITGSYIQDKIADGTTNATVVKGTVSGLLDVDRTNNSVTITASASFPSANAGLYENIPITYTLSDTVSGSEASEHYVAPRTDYATAVITANNPIPVQIIGVSYDLASMFEYGYFICEAGYKKKTITAPNGGTVSLTLQENTYMYDIDLSNITSEVDIQIIWTGITLVGTDTNTGAAFVVYLQMPSNTVPSIMITGAGTYMDMAGVPSTWEPGGLYRLELYNINGNVVSKIEKW